MNGKLSQIVIAALGLVVVIFAIRYFQQPATPPDEPTTRSKTVTIGPDTPRGPSIRDRTKPPPPDTKEGEDASPEDENENENEDENESENEEENEGSESGFAFLLGDGTTLTEDARTQPDMREIGPDDARYNPLTEAQQLFAPFEDTLRETDPLTPEAWKAALEVHRERNLGVMKRADFLRQSGYPEEGGELMVEWSRLYGIYQAQAYGR